MSIAQELKTIINQALEQFGISGVNFTLEHPTDLSHGDYACNVAMVAAKQVGKNPRELADQIVAEIQKASPPLLAGEGLGVRSAGPGFINFTISQKFFATCIPEIISAGDQFGKNNNLQGQTWVIEHTSPNPNKAMHLGHLRNNLTGMAIANIAEANGVTVIRDEVDNNRGIAIAKLMWGYLKFGRKDGDITKTDVVYWADHEDEWKIPEDMQLRPDRFVDQFYVLGAEDFKNESVEMTVRDFVVKWEAHDETIWKLWKKVLDYSYRGQELTLKRLGNKWDYVWHEHEHYQKGKDLVEQGLQKKVFKIGDGGAIVTDFHDEKLPDTVLIKSDGTSLYLTQDIALTKLKREKYAADKLFWVIGPEQSLALKQLFRVCEQLGIGKESDYTHLAYGYVSLMKNGEIEKMSSRLGNVVFIDDLIDTVKAVALTKLREGDDELAEIIALGAIKFAILFTGRLTDTAFDIDRATNLDGDSGPYLQYTHARIVSIKEKSTIASIIPRYTSELEQVHAIERIVYRFPEVVENALVEYAPNYIATYLVDLAREFNSFYAMNTIVDVDHPEISAHRLAITQAVQTVLKNGLWLLGITAPEKM
jgi:arginyl-tRNA synthetase